MKKLAQQLGKLIILLLSFFLIAASCRKDDTPDIEKQDPSPNPDGVEQDSVIIDTDGLLTMDTTKIIQNLKSSKRRKL